MEHLKGASLMQAPVLLAKIRQGWKGLQGTNTLAYFKHSVNSFIILVTGVNVIKLLFFTAIV
jgi:hypothetical protein